MTLKTGVMAAENSALPSYIVILNCNNVSQYYCFYCLFDPINDQI